MFDAAAARDGRDGADRHRAIHHARRHLHAQPRDRRPQRRHVPRADVTARARPRCTGTCTTTARGTSACTRSAARRCRWRSCSAARASCPTPPPPRCRRASRNCCSPASSTAAGSSWCQCKTIDLEVPANAEIVIEGYVDPNEKLMEGPFGDHTGFYSLADWYPAFHVTAITHAEEPDLPDHDRRQAADGGLLPRQGDRADLPAAAEDARAGHRRLLAADQRRVPQLRVHQDPQGIPATRPGG